MARRRSITHQRRAAWRIKVYRAMAAVFAVSRTQTAAAWNGQAASAKEGGHLLRCIPAYAMPHTRTRAQTTT